MFESSEMLVFWGVAFFWLGACFGSFANVVILRLPDGKSVVFPRSHCFSCQNQIHWFDNIPIVSWFVLRGKCRKCKEKISFRYPSVELLTGILFSAIYVLYGWSFTGFELTLFAFCLVVVSVIDLDHMILPDVFTLSGIVIGLLGALLNAEREFMDAIMGVLFGGGFFWLIAYLYIVIRKVEGLGGGDIKLLAWIGAVLGWMSIPYVILVASILGSVVGLLVALKKGTSLKTVIPFGPFLSLAAISYVFGGNIIALWYLRLFFPWL